MIIPLERIVRWIDQSGKPTNRAASFIEEMTRQVNASTVLSGSGSPEGSVEANPKTLYMDETGSAGNILYIKKTGTGNTGWVLVQS